MRTLIAALLATTALPAALPALAETLPATSRITAVTVYPDGARITREVAFAVPGPGRHDLIVTDLPAETDPGLIRLQGGDGLALGAFALRDDRLPPADAAPSPEMVAAQAGIDTAEAALRQAQAAVAAVQARIDAAAAQAAFLSSFSGALPAGATPETVRAMAAMIGAETLAAAGTAAAARAELWPAEKAAAQAAEALARAQAAHDALPADISGHTALAVSVEAGAAGPQVVTVTHYIASAGWRPFYDLSLTRDGGGRLTIDRAVLVTQDSGEDWDDVALTLSTARPSEQSAPSGLWPDLRRILPEAEMRMADGAYAEAGGSGMGADYAVAAAEPAAVAVAGIEGDTVVYAYPGAVDVAAGVEDLRLPLDRIEAAPEVVAVAVPRGDRTAFVEAAFVNPTAEPLLEGEALVYREGVLVGRTGLPRIAPGETARLAFGALDTLKLTRAMPRRDEGQTGVFTTSNEASESAVLTVENLGDEGWPVRLLDQVPYSEQSDLVIETEASPAPSETDVDGQRGILAWTFDLPAGQKKDVTLTTRMRWPEGMVLQ